MFGVKPVKLGVAAVAVGESDVVEGVIVETVKGKLLSSPSGTA